MTIFLPHLFTFLDCSALLFKIACHRSNRLFRPKYILLPSCLCGPLLYAKNDLRSISCTEINFDKTKLYFVYSPMRSRICRTAGENTLNTIFYSRNVCSNLCIMQKLISVYQLPKMLTLLTKCAII